MNSEFDSRTIFRRLSVFDQECFTRHLLRLDSDGRRLRFGMAATDAFLTEYAKGCIGWGVVIYGYFVDGVMRGAAELRPIEAWRSREAEAAFSVEDRWRGRGVGGGLFARILRAARNRGYRKLYMSCLVSNRAMQSLARKFKADVTFERGGTVGVIDPGAQNLGSYLDEAGEQAASYAFASIDVPRIALIRPLSWLVQR